jgi:hypothetical protein
MISCYQLTQTERYNITALLRVRRTHSEVASELGRMAVTFKVVSAARLYRTASSDRRELGCPQGYALCSKSFFHCAYAFFMARRGAQCERP